MLQQLCIDAQSQAGLIVKSHKTKRDIFSVQGGDQHISKWGKIFIESIDFSALLCYDRKVDHDPTYMGLMRCYA